MKVTVGFRFSIFFTFVISVTLMSRMSVELAPWGFYGHRLINRLAIFTLPPDLLYFYKNHIDYIEDHAIDPDKRRYVMKSEGIKHFIDLDLYRHSFERLQKMDWVETVLSEGYFHFIDIKGDTVVSKGSNLVLVEKESGNLNRNMRDLLLKHQADLLSNGYLSLGFNISDDLVPSIIQNPIEGKLVFEDRFSRRGILPFQLMWQYRSLVRAFRSMDVDRILRYSAELGHYLADAHVPLHTTSNYNGQKTNQVGIHAFWESRLPELFAVLEYDFFVGRAKHEEQIDSFYWDIVFKSHSLVPKVLSADFETRMKIPSDRQYCFVERNVMTSRMECEDFARAYQDALGGMVEDQMRDAILHIGTTWYSAWKEAGSPNLSSDTPSNKPLENNIILDSLSKETKILGRPHN